MLKSGGEKVRLEGEESVGCLHEIPLRDSPNLVGHPALVLETRTEVLDDGIGEHDVDRRVTITPEVAPVTADVANSRSRLRLRQRVEHRDLDVAQISGAHERPELLRAADVEDAH